MRRRRNGSSVQDLIIVILVILASILLFRLFVKLFYQSPEIESGSGYIFGGDTAIAILERQLPEMEQIDYHLPEENPLYDMNDVDNDAVEVISAGSGSDTTSRGNMINIKGTKKASDEIIIEIKNAQSSVQPVTLTGNGPTVMIYHTHSREAYLKTPNEPYVAAGNFRTKDLMKTVVGVGDVLARELTKEGISVFHDRTDHEKYDWNTGMYKHSLNTIENAQEKYDDLQVYIDIHRNYFKMSADRDDHVVYIDGKRVAKFFFVVGTGKGSVVGFSQKPNYQENYKLAKAVTELANKKYPGLASEVDIKSGRYNQHVSAHSMLIEIGNHLTSAEEARLSAGYLAEILGEVLKE